MILTINGKQAALKKGSSIEYVSENRIFTDADDYSMEIELPLEDCPQNLDIFGMMISASTYIVSYRIIMNHIVPQLWMSLRGWYDNCNFATYINNVMLNYEGNELQL